MNKTLHNIATKYRINITNVYPLHGGSINQVYLLKCKEGDFVIKINDAALYTNMFEAESKGLEILRSSNSFKIPKVFFVGKEGDVSYLCLQYFSEGEKTSKSWMLFSENLAKLHQTKNEYFGLKHQNYIGSLTQYNLKETTASEFYINQRLIPQFKIASKNGFHFSGLDAFFKTITDVIPKESPSLIHGDLWNGNYMVTNNEEPAPIDPAVAFAPREMDLAMMKLFGGFPIEVFEKYHEIFPLEREWQNRITLWQLYYLLVHLNLFGSSYLSQVKNIITKYS